MSPRRSATSFYRSGGPEPIPPSIGCRFAQFSWPAIQDPANITKAMAIGRFAALTAEAQTTDRCGSGCFNNRSADVVIQRALQSQFPEPTPRWVSHCTMPLTPPAIIRIDSRRIRKCWMNCQNTLRRFIGRLSANATGPFAKPLTEAVACVDVVLGIPRRSAHSCENIGPNRDGACRSDVASRDRCRPVHRRQ